MNTYLIDYNRIQELCEIFENDYEMFTIELDNKSQGPILLKLRDCIKDVKVAVITNNSPKVWFHNKFEYKIDKEKLCFEIGERVE